MKPLTAKEAERYLRRAGYVFLRMRGSHAIWQNPTSGHSVPVPHHGNAPIAQGTLLSIFRACGIDKPQR